MLISTPTLRYVSRRLAAFVVDACLLYAGVVTTQALLYTAGLHPFRAALEAGAWPGGSPLHLWVFLSASVPFWLYYASFHSSRWQATPGKRLLGLRVTDTAGGRLGFGRALLRAVVMLIPFEVNHFVILQLAGVDGVPYGGLALVYGLLAVYLGVMLADPRRRSVHDWAAASQVA